MAKPVAERQISEGALFLAGAIYGATTPIGREMGTWLHPLTITALRFALALPFCMIGLYGTPRTVNAPLRRLIPVALL